LCQIPDKESQSLRRKRARELSLDTETAQTARNESTNPKIGNHRVEQPAKKAGKSSCQDNAVQDAWTDVTRNEIRNFHCKNRKEIRAEQEGPIEKSNTTSLATRINSQKNESTATSNTTTESSNAISLIARIDNRSNETRTESIWNRLSTC